MCLYTIRTHAVALFELVMALNKCAVRAVAAGSSQRVVVGFESVTSPSRVSVVFLDKKSRKIKDILTF